MREEIIQKRLEKKKREREKFKKKALAFKTKYGKLIKGFALLAFVLSSLYFIDLRLGPTYEKKEIKSVATERHNVVSGGGWYVPATYYHVYLNDAETYDFFMYKGEYFKAKPLGYIEVGRSMIFGIHQTFRVGKGADETVKPLEGAFFFEWFTPILLIIVSGVLFFLPPEHSPTNFSAVRFMTLVVAVLFIVLVIDIVDQNVKNDEYEMAVSSLKLPR